MLFKRNYKIEDRTISFTIALNKHSCDPPRDYPPKGR